MNKSCFKALFLALLLSLIAVVSVSAETLALDNNGIPIQFGRYWTCVSDSIPVQSPSIADSVAVPADAYEVTIIYRHQAGYVRPDSATSVSAADWVYIPKDSPLTLPVQYVDYIVYRSATGAARINLYWKRL